MNIEDKKLDLEIMKKWREESRKQTLETLPAFIEEIKSYKHCYSSIVTGMASAANATISALDRSECGGITGFQSVCLMWEMVGLLTFKEGPMKLISFEDMLYPQNEEKFSKVMTKKTFECLQDKATELLKDKMFSAHPDVKKHWQSIVDGVVPFGYEIEYLK